MGTAMRLRRVLSSTTDELVCDEQSLSRVSKDLEVMKQRLAKLQARGGDFASIGFGEAVVDLMKRLDKATVRS